MHIGRCCSTLLQVLLEAYAPLLELIRDPRMSLACLRPADQILAVDMLSAALAAAVATGDQSRRSGELLSSCVFCLPSLTRLLPDPSFADPEPQIAAAALVLALLEAQPEAARQQLLTAAAGDEEGCLGRVVRAVGECRQPAALDSLLQALLIVLAPSQQGGEAGVQRARELAVEAGALGVLLRLTSELAGSHADSPAAQAALRALCVLLELPGGRLRLSGVQGALQKLSMLCDIAPSQVYTALHNICSDSGVQAMAAQVRSCSLFPLSLEAAAMCACLALAVLCFGEGRHICTTFLSCKGSGNINAAHKDQYMRYERQMWATLGLLWAQGAEQEMM